MLGRYMQGAQLEELDSTNCSALGKKPTKCLALSVINFTSHFTKCTVFSSYTRLISMYIVYIQKLL